MILNTFKNSQPATLFLVPVFMAIFWISAWHGGVIQTVDNPMPLYSLLTGIIPGFPGWFAGVIGYLLTTLQVLHLNYIIGKHEVLYKNSHLPALFYMVFVSIIPQFLFFHPVMIVNSLMILAVDRLFKIYKNPAPLSLAFDVCFIISVASLFYFPAISFVILFALSILILKTFSWRDWLVGLLGVALPYFFAFVYFFWTDGLQEFIQKLYIRDFRLLWNVSGLILQGYRITLIVLAVLFVLTLIKIRQNFYKNATRVRNFQQVIFIFMMVAVLSLAFTGSVAIYRFSILTIPFATMISYYFLAAKKKWISELLFWLLIGTLVVNHVSAW